MIFINVVLLMAFATVAEAGRNDFQTINIFAMMGSGAACVALGFITCWFVFSERSDRAIEDEPREVGKDKKSSLDNTLDVDAESVSPGFIRASLRKNDSFVWASGLPILRVVITGVSAALPGRNSAVFSPGVNNIHRIISGESFITEISREVKDSMMEKNVVIARKGANGKMEKVPITAHEDNISLSASMSGGDFNLASYGVPQSICDTMDRAVQVSVAAGLEALRDAGIVSGEGEGTKGWVLPEHLQPTTGIVYATSFPALDTAITEVTDFFRTRDVNRLGAAALVSCLKNKFTAQMSEEGMSSEVEKAFADLETAAAGLQSVAGEEMEKEGSGYEFDRKFLFRVLVLGNAQLAQIVKARGPNMQTNAACAGSTQAIAIAHDMIQLGRAERMIVIAGDNASSDALMPWLGNGFRALGAATICSNVADAARPFDAIRSGMILGSGGIGMVLESEEGARRRHITALKYGQAHAMTRPAFKCRLLGSLYSNSAYHGAALDREHIAQEMERFIASAEKEHSISRKIIAQQGVYFSHETSTNASPTASCASNEVRTRKSHLSM